MSDTDPDDVTERSAREAYKTLSTRVWTIAFFAATLAITGAISGIRDHDRIDVLEQRVSENHTAITATAPVIGDVRSDLRVIRVELQQLATTTTDVQARVTRIEDSGRRTHQ